MHRVMMKWHSMQGTRLRSSASRWMAGGRLGTKMMHTVPLDQWVYTYHNTEGIVRACVFGCKLSILMLTVRFAYVPP